LVTVSSPEVIWAYEEAMNIDKKGIVQATGNSRTDVFYDGPFIKAAYDKLYNLLPQAKDKKIILFAPTFRGRVAQATSPDCFDVEGFCKAFSDEYLLLFKHHPNVKVRPEIPEEYNEFAFDFTDSMAIDELLCVSDICISDYSSLVFEYSLFEKPMIFFAYDLDEYFDWRGFYYDYFELAPGPVCKTNEEMIDYIRHIDERFERDKVVAFREKFMASCDGHATERIKDIVFGQEALEKYYIKKDVELEKRIMEPSVYGRKGVEGIEAITEKPNNPKVSVVMPVYNVADYLESTLNDVANQSLKDIEIICVDDGSTDGSDKILDEYAKKDARITVIHQQNQYAGVARNNGLAAAKGKYVIFWDSDDIFDINALEKLYIEAERTQAEIVVCDADEVNESTGVYSLPAYLKLLEIPENRPFSRQDIGDKIFDFAGNVPWNKLYLKSFIKEHDIIFEGTRQYNDIYFVMLAFYYATKISVVPDVLIHYRFLVEGSITNKISKDPLSMYRTYLKLQDVMSDDLNRDANLKRAFQNKAFAGFMRLVNLQTSFEGYDMVLACYRDEASKQLEIDSMREEDFFAPWMYEHSKVMLNNDTNGYMVWKLRNRYLENKISKDKIKKLKIRRDELRTRRDEIKAELQEKRDIIKENNAVLASKPVRLAIKFRTFVRLVLYGKR
jgi:glycosyltransferase involved in cell wall biosynthesis